MWFLLKLYLVQWLFGSVLVFAKKLVYQIKFLQGGKWNNTKLAKRYQQTTNFSQKFYRNLSHKFLLYYYNFLKFQHQMRDFALDFVSFCTLGLPTWNTLVALTISPAGLLFKHVFISIELVVGHSSKLATVAVFSLTFSANTHGLSAHPLCDIPPMKRPKKVVFKMLSREGFFSN